MSRVTITFLLVLTFGSSPASAQTSAADSAAGLFRTSDLAYAAAFFGSLLAIESLKGIDASLSPDSPPTGFTEDLVRMGNAFGNGVVVYSLGGVAFLGGELFGVSRLSRVGIRALGALAASSVIVLPAKVTVGRHRPSGGGGDSDEFDSFAFNAESFAFPSGHTASAFALAGAVSNEFSEDAPWVPYVAYPLALLTGVSRVVDRKHWATDVIAGAAVGIFAAEFSGRLFGSRETQRGIVGSIRPIVSAGGDGWMLGLSARP
ncbi:MAG: phosphatase PAP2 family protein [Gemmatimonadales bacterium]|nr:MAG: phosphatase PAP2 family protein [Gemmatimonadales bacterium]